MADTFAVSERALQGIGECLAGEGVGRFRRLELIQGGILTWAYGLGKIQSRSGGGSKNGCGDCLSGCLSGLARNEYWNRKTDKEGTR